jgi:outer membrane protein OmpA-like peptidoglycan-associated protein
MKKTIFLFAILLLFGRSIDAQTNSFGSKDVSLISIKGTIYSISDQDYQMPAGIENQTPLGVIYTKMIDVPDHEFSEGFPGVTDRYEYFGIIYSCVFEISKAGMYTWKIGSDDGSILWIDGKEFINKDGIHSWEEGIDSLNLTVGSHTMKVWYFQGPATELGVQLYITEPGAAEEKIFNIEDFSANLSKVLKKVNAETTAEGIKIKLPDKILFDVGKSDLKPEATETLKSLIEVFNSYPNGKVKIEGHTDATGDAVSNLKLSEDRAKSVLASLQKLGVPKTITFTTVGMGSTKPVASNDTDDGRAQNRRVEIIILP